MPTMMTRPNDKAPNFWESLANALRLSASVRGAWAFVPWMFILCCVVPLAGYFLFWNERVLPAEASTDIVGLLAASATVGSFYGALSIFAMTQIQVMCGKYPFSDYLRELKVFDIYLVLPQLALLIQIVSIMTNLAGIILLVAEPKGRAIDVAALLGFGTILYASTKTWGIVELIRNLTWHFADYERKFQEALARHSKQA